MSTTREPAPKIIALDAEATRRVKDLRRRGWSIAGIARHLGVDRDLVAGALGEGSVLA